VPQLGGPNLDEATPRLAALLFVAASELPQTSHGITHRVRCGAGRGNQPRRVATKLRPQPPARVGHAGAFSHTGAQTEPVQRPKCRVHRQTTATPL
jgi:hypothetical protein